MCSLQQRTIVLHAQQQQHKEKIEELQAEEERVIGIIHPVHQKVREVSTSLETNMPKHVSFDLVKHMQKIEEEVHAEK